MYGIASACIVLAIISASAYALPAGDMPESLPAEFDFDSGIFGLDMKFLEPSGIKRYVIFGTGTGADLLSNPIHGVQSKNGFFYVAAMPESTASDLLNNGYHVMEDFELDYHTMDASKIGLITGSDAAHAKYETTGRGVTIGIVDTGVDFSNPDISHSLARDKLNHPLMLDPDGQGLVITNSTFYAFIDSDDIIRNYSRPIPKEFTSGVYQSKEGVFLDIDRGGQGTIIPVYNSFFPQVGQAPTFNGTLNNDMKIGNNNRDYIKSQSGIYHLGMIYQGALEGPYTRVQVVPVLVVDSHVPGLYDTIIPDMSTSWEDFTKSDLEEGMLPDYDFDFTDERPIVLGSGNEFLVYDSDGDGRTDYSAGTAGARVLDVYNVMTNKTILIDDALRAVNGTLLESFDGDGNFFGIMSDFIGHGTSSAASIVSAGTQTYDIYNDTGSYTIRGVAPDAKILPIKALWFGDTAYAWLWAAGFENNNMHWNFTGKPRADIISNSWGISAFPSFGSAPGMDILSLISSMLAVPGALDDDFHGITMVSSAGNSGHGYGTIGAPGASPFGITVGATTNNVFVGYGPFEGEPRFGNSTIHHGHMVDFSSRGPGILGDPKPDLANIGAFGFVPSNTLKMEKNSDLESFTLFGGTSMAAPLVSGSAAVLMEALYNQQKDYDAFTIKNILMSTATDLRNDPFTQGSGLSNIDAALDYIHGKGAFLVYNDASYGNISKVLAPAVLQVNSTGIGLEKFMLPPKNIPMTSWFAGQLRPGQYSTATFTVENPTSMPLDITVTPQNLSLIQQEKFDGVTEPRLQEPFLNKTDAYIPNYVNLSDVKQHQRLAEFFADEDPIPEESSLLVLGVNFAFNDFMNKTDDMFANDIKISSLYLYDWIDSNNDTAITSEELSMVSRAGSWGTAQELRISDPAHLFEGTPIVGVYPVPTRFSYWTGNTDLNSTAMPYTITASYYQKERWPVIWPDAENITVPPNDSITVDVNLAVPTDFQTGNYQGFLVFEGGGHTVNAPVSFTVVQHVAAADSAVMVPGRDSGQPIFKNGEIRGAFDMASRFMAGDWRQYYFEIENNSIDSGAIELSWMHEDTNLAVFVMNPQGQIIQTNMPSGVFGHFLDWPSLDWLGVSPFSQGGGFYPVKNKNDTSTVLLVPINQTGTYSMLVHSTLFGSNSTVEPVSLVARFANLQDARMPEIHVLPESDMDSGMFADTTLNDITPDYATPDDTLPDTSPDTIPPMDLTPPSMAPALPESLVFNYGLILGVIVGIAVTLISVFILRQRPQDAPRPDVN